MHGPTIIALWLVVQMMDRLFWVKRRPGKSFTYSMLIKASRFLLVVGSNSVDKVNSWLQDLQMESWSSGILKDEYSFVHSAQATLSRWPMDKLQQSGHPLQLLSVSMCRTPSWRHQTKKDALASIQCQTWLTKEVRLPLRQTTCPRLLNSAPATPASTRFSSVG